MSRYPNFPLRLHWMAAIVASVSLGGCEGPMQSSASTTAGDADAIRQAAPALHALAGRRVYFGHQSVGMNLLHGIEQLSTPDARLRVVETDTPASVQGPALMHFRAGRNGDPASKNRDLLAVLDARPTRDSALVLLKYCYVDMLPNTDVPALFAAYQQTIAEAKRRNPDVTFVHATMPLTTAESGVRAVAKRLLGRQTARALDAKRNAYNDLLRHAYAGREPLFDLASVESTLPNGSRSYFLDGRDTVYTLAAAYTDDGGHLNDAAQRRAAAALLSVLSGARP